jgi:DNA invertase Pin-like site-specific DNA recombinase
MKRAIGYIRRSAKSDESTVSLDTQRHAIAGYAEKEGVHLVWTVEHDGVSGGKRSRIEDIESKLCFHDSTVVVVYHLDRFARDTAAQLDALRRFGKNGYELHVVGRGKVEIDSSSGFLATGVEALIAEHYRRVVSEKTRDALEELKATGRRYSRHAPYGYRIEVDARLVPDEQEQKILAVIEDLHKFSGLGVRRLIAALNSRGYTARSGKPFAPSTIHGILRSLEATEKQLEGE